MESVTCDAATLRMISPGVRYGDGEETGMKMEMASPSL